MKVLVCGDRNWTNRQHLYNVLDALHAFYRFDLVIEGEAKGADRMARDWCEKRGVSVRKFPALWGMFKKAAGPIRNQQMLEQGKPDLIVAFHNDFGNSTGTRDMVRRGMGKMVPYRLYTDDSPWDQPAQHQGSIAR